MPWQRYVADVAHEVDPATGRLAYREVVVFIPRQSGKTTLGLSARVHRAVGPFGDAQKLLYTAQTRNEAREKWEDEHWPILAASVFARFVRIRKRTGAEAFVWRNGSIDGIPAPTEKAGHGKTLDLGFIDEAFAQVDDRLEQAFRPAMITRPQPQLWVVSTAGTEKSTYLRSKVKAGRKREQTGDRGDVCYFEWSAPNDADPMDPATWWACMPALGHTITEDAIRAELRAMVEEHGPDGLQLFRRAYLNQWVDEFAVGWSVIREPAWRLRGGAQDRPTGPTVLAIAAADPDAEATSIGISGERDGELLVQVVEHRAGTSWVVERAAELVRRWRPAAVIVDKKDPAGRLIPDLDDDPDVGPLLKHPSVGDVVQACGRFHLLVTGDEPTIRHYGQRDLDNALAAAQKQLRQGGWTWAEFGSTDGSPLRAVTLAAWGVSTYGPPPASPQTIRGGSGRATDDLRRAGF